MKKKFLKSSVAIATVCTVSTTMVFANGINENIVKEEDISKDMVAQEFLKETETLDTKNTDDNNTISVSNVGEFKAALNSAKGGETIFIDGQIDLNSEAIGINKNIIIQGTEDAVIKGGWLAIHPSSNVTIKNVTFDTSSYNAISTDVSATDNFKGKLIIDGCKFINAKYNSIQALPCDEAEIEITNCTFDATPDGEVNRYIHIQSTEKVDGYAITQDKVKVKIVNNTFNNIDNVKSHVMCIANIKYSNVKVGHNKVENSSQELDKKIWVGMFNQSEGNNERLDNTKVANNVVMDEEVKINKNIDKLVSSSSDLERALQKAEDGDSIVISGIITLKDNLKIDKSVTIKGENNAVITGAPVSIDANADVTINNIKFDSPVNKNNNASAIYATNLKSKLTINGCEFIDSQWDAIQITPVSGAEIVIENCTFDTTDDIQGANGKGYGYRYIHIQATEKKDDKVITQPNVNIRIVGNTFRNIQRMKNDAIDVDYVDLDNVIVGKNKVEDSTISLKEKVYAKNDKGLFSKIHLANNILSKEEVKLNYNIEHIEEGICPGCGGLDSEITDSLIGDIESIIGEVGIEGSIEGIGTELDPIVISLAKVEESKQINNVVKEVKAIVEKLSNKFKNYDSEIIKNKNSEYIIYRIKFNSIKQRTRLYSNNEASSFIEIKVNKNNIKLIEKLDKIFNKKEEIPSTSPEFNDIKGHWAEFTIKLFTYKNFVNGYEDGTFRPDNSMTRAEFVKVVNKVFGYKEKGEEQFTDVSKDDWFYDDICIGIKEGYIKGKSNDTFAPNDNITRQEVAMILTNIMNNKDENLDKLNAFKDGDKTDKWAQSSVEGAIEAGYLEGYEDKTIRANGDITRAEAISMLRRVKN